MLAALASLVKPRIVALLTLTGLGALFAAGGGPLATVGAFTVAGATIAAASATFNCYYDRHLDRRMARTADRPLPSGDLAPRVALAFGAGLFLAGSTIGVVALPLASVASMWAGAIAYVGLYTVVLKRRHPIGVVLGGSAGSFPVLAGWAAVAPLEPVALAMAALVFAWTPAHAWALAYVYRDDFARAGVATLPAVATTSTVARAVWVSALLTAAVGFAVALAAGPLYLGAVAVASPLFVLAVGRFRQAPCDRTAVAAFFASNTYLAVLFLAWGTGGVIASGFGPGAVAGGALAALAFVGLARGAPTLRDTPEPAYPLASLFQERESTTDADVHATRPATDGGTRERDVNEESARPPRELLVEGTRNAWRTTKSVYYADSWSWRALKCGGLVFLGFCLWAAANVVLSYRSGWTPLRYVLAYGFLLAIYGPIHHAVVIPLSLRLRTRADRLSRVGRRLPTALLVVFLVAVLVLGTWPVGPMTIDFQSALADASGDVNAQLHCVSGAADDATEIHCHLDDSEGVDRVVVESGGRELLVDDDPPFEWTVETADLAEVRGEKQFTVVLQDEDGALLRQYTRRVPQIDGERVT